MIKSNLIPSIVRGSNILGYRLCGGKIQGFALRGSNENVDDQNDK